MANTVTDSPVGVVRCHGIRTAGSPGGTRYISGCPVSALPGGIYCPQHQREADYRRRRMERMLSDMTDRLRKDQP